MFPAMKPPRARAANSIQRVIREGQPDVGERRAEQAAASTGRRPTRSLSRPHSGAAMNWASE